MVMESLWPFLKGGGGGGGGPAGVLEGGGGGLRAHWGPQEAGGKAVGEEPETGHWVLF